VRLLDRRHVLALQVLDDLRLQRLLVVHFLDARRNLVEPGLQRRAITALTGNDLEDGCARLRQLGVERCKGFARCARNHRASRCADAPESAPARRSGGCWRPAPRAPGRQSVCGDWLRRERPGRAAGCGIRPMACSPGPAPPHRSSGIALSGSTFSTGILRGGHEHGFLPGPSVSKALPPPHTAQVPAGVLPTAAYFRGFSGCWFWGFYCCRRRGWRRGRLRRKMG
jgi:hypothetical protein